VYGVEPDRPATGYGWLRRGERVGAWGGQDVFRLDAFVEKPDAARAQELLAAGGHFFNAGLFAFRPEALEIAYVTHLPDMVDPLKRMARAFPHEEFERVLKTEFGALQKISIDYGVMERLTSALLLPLKLRWDDVGSWDALARLRPADEQGNVAEGDVLVLQAARNIVSARDGVVAIKGVDDLIVVHTPDATLVCRRGDEQGVKQIVEALQAAGLEKYL
jgi:mannose-1-phosphate guanylyltransferase